MDKLPENVRVLRFFGASESARKAAVEKLTAGGELKTQEMCKGGEVLVLLQAGLESAGANRSLLDAATEQIAAAVGPGLYGTDDITLPDAAIAAIKRADQLFVAADGATGERMRQRLQDLPAAAAVFDFGTQSYAHPRFGADIEAGGTLGQRAGKDALLAAQGRIREAYKHSGADYAVACVPAAAGYALLVGSKKGYWMHTIPSQGENAALWLLDMLRRAAMKAEQANGTVWLSYGDTASAEPKPEQAPEHRKSAVPEPAASEKVFSEKDNAQKSESVCSNRVDPESMPQPDVRDVRMDEPQESAEKKQAASPKKSRAAGLLVGLLAVAILAVAAVAAVWFISGGDILAFWQRSGIHPFNGSGASLL